MKKYPKFAVYLFSGEIFVHLLNFFANIYLARVLGAEGFGLITIGISFLGYSILLSDSGMKILGFLEAAKPENNRKFNLFEIFVSKIIQSAVLFSVLYLLIYIVFTEPETRTICSVYLLLILFDALFVDWLYKGIQKFGIISCARILSSLVYLISVYFWVKGPEDTVKVPALYFITSMASAIILIAAYPLTNMKIIFTFSIKKYFSILRSSLTLGISTFFNQVTIYLPPIIIGKFIGVYETGILGAALKIVILIMILDRVFSTIFLSELPKLWERNRVKTEKYLQTILNSVITFSMLISLLLSLESGNVISMIFGNKYEESKILLSIISWFFAFTVINSIFVYGLITVGEKRHYLKASFKGFIINCIIITGMTYLFGTVGAGVSIVLGEMIFIVFCYKEFVKFVRIHFYPHFIKNIFICLSSYITFHILIINKPLRYIFVLCFYFALSYLLKTVSKNDLKLIYTKWKQD